MSGLDYDKLEEHKKEVKSDWENQLGLGANTEEGFFNMLHREEVERGSKTVRFYALSVPVCYFSLFQDTVWKDYMQQSPSKLSVNHILGFAGVLRNHQTKFFGENEDYSRRREKLVQTGHKLSGLDTHMTNNFGIALSNYAILIDQIKDPKLDIYVNRVLRASELNCNLVSAVSNGLVPILQNLSVGNANLFLSEAFELIADEGGYTPGLEAAQKYLTLSTESSLKRFAELVDRSD